MSRQQHILSFLIGVSLLFAPLLPAVALTPPAPPAPPQDEVKLQESFLKLQKKSHTTQRKIQQAKVVMNEKITHETKKRTMEKTRRAFLKKRLKSSGKL